MDNNNYSFMLATPVSNKNKTNACVQLVRRAEKFVNKFVLVKFI